MRIKLYSQSKGLFIIPHLFPESDSVLQLPFDLCGIPDFCLDELYISCNLLDLEMFRTDLDIDTQLLIPLFFSH